VNQVSRRCQIVDQVTSVSGGFFPVIVFKKRLDDWSTNWEFSSFASHPVQATFVRTGTSDGVWAHHFCSSDRPPSII